MRKLRVRGRQWLFVPLVVVLLLAVATGVLLMWQNDDDGSAEGEAAETIGVTTPEQDKASATQVLAHLQENPPADTAQKSVWLQYVQDVLLASVMADDTKAGIAAYEQGIARKMRLTDYDHTRAFQLYRKAGNDTKAAECLDRADAYIATLPQDDDSETGTVSQHDRITELRQELKGGE